MHATVLAVFSGTDVDPALFNRALEAANREHGRLVLLDVRHRQQTDRLAEYLEAESPLGRATVRALQRSVKQQRSRAIETALESLADEGRRRGVEVAILEEKGALAETVRRVVRELGVTTVVLPGKTPSIGLGERVRTIWV